MDLKIIYEDKNLLVVDKPAGIPVYSKEKNGLMNEIVKELPLLKEVGKFPRYGLVHRLDKETSGILLIAKNKETFDFLQQQFKEREVIKKYLALVKGNIEHERVIKKSIGRDLKNRRKQKAYLPHSPEAQKKGVRKATTEIKPIRKFKDYTLIEAIPKTGRKHQIRVHLRSIDHPVIGDKIYSFKDQSSLGLKRQFLHAHHLKIKLLDQKEKEFNSELPENLKETIKNLK